MILKKMVILLACAVLWSFFPESSARGDDGCQPNGIFLFWQLNPCLRLTSKVEVAHQELQHKQPILDDCLLPSLAILGKALAFLGQFSNKQEQSYLL